MLPYACSALVTKIALTKVEGKWNRLIEMFRFYPMNPGDKNCSTNLLNGIITQGIVTLKIRVEELSNQCQE